VSSPLAVPPPLRLGDLDPDPHRQFAVWLEAARDAGVHEPEAMTLATASADGAPSARMVLLRGHGPDGFALFTNYRSRKARDLDANPRAALVFHWDSLGRQIRVEGTVARMAASESDAYFATRPRGSRIGAWASPQSTPIADRDTLERTAAEVGRRFGDGQIPRPDHWGGYRLTATAFEFWQHGQDRLHDRFRYLPAGGGWSIERLAP
jgi:pyridoxamine 5'-phosphate oxidase